MKIALVVLSDIHFDSVGENPPLSRASLIAGAASSENVQLDGLVVVLAGDIANNGTKAEYHIAETFLQKLSSAFKSHYPLLTMNLMAVPGNHDCILPKEEVDHRHSQVESSIKTFNEEKPDRVFINHLLQVQQEYWEFIERLNSSPSGDYGRLWNVKQISFSGQSLHFNLYNSAALSQRHEDRGQIYMPVRMLAQEVPLPPKNEIVISVVHHPLQWLQPDNFVAFRRHLLRSSDLVLTGHQHKTGSYYQTHDTGESLRFFESPPLYDREEREGSGFRVITFDLSSSTMKDCTFEWKGTLYRPEQAVIEWRPIEMNRAIRSSFEVQTQFMSSVSDPGVVYSHPDRAKVALSDLFVYPDLKPVGGNSARRAIRGGEVVRELASEGVHLIQGDAFSGKTALAKSIFRDYFIEDRQVPILIDGFALTARDLAQFERSVRKAFSEQYSNADLDAYLQLLPSQRVVIIDDWHFAKISGEQRIAIYRWLQDFAISSILFTDKFYEINRIVTKRPVIDPSMPSEESIVVKLEPIGLSHLGRGELIHRWLNLRKKSDAEPVEVSKESKTTEDEVSRLLGKDSLPPYAFFIICLLQARENRTINKIAGGSFGHLYEVLITSALIKGENDGSQLDRKYALLSEIAAYIWRNEKLSLSVSEVQEVAEAYSKAFLLDLKVDDLLRGLEAAFVLKRSGSQISFTYPHFYYYFVARYIRDRIDDAEDNKLLESIDYMIDHMSSGINSNVIMFLIYFAKEKRRIIDRLVDNASRIYAEVEPARLQDDALPFFFRKEEPVTPVLTEQVDVAMNRREERLTLDARSSEMATSTEHPEDETYAYTDELGDLKKLHLADRNLDALGQIVRNFSTTLPEKDKIKVLKCAYLLGLRTMARTMTLLASFLAATETILELRDRLGMNAEQDLSLLDMKRQLDRMALTTGKAVALIFIKKISSSVGVADMEQAYRKVMEFLPTSNAMKITELTIRIDHFREFPESQIIELHKELRSNPFAEGVLQWIVASYLLLFGVDRKVRQRISSQLGLSEDKILKLSLNQ